MTTPDFNEKTIVLIARQAGYRCSAGFCDRITVGPNNSGDKTTLIGEAAHIRGARPGPRYDPAMSDEDRADISNAIWLCSVHHKMIDDDPITYNPNLLEKWRADHERKIRQEIEQPTGRKNNNTIQLPSLIIHSPIKYWFKYELGFSVWSKHVISPHDSIIDKNNKLPNILPSDLCFIIENIGPGSAEDISCNWRFSIKEIESIFDKFSGFNQIYARMIIYDNKYLLWSKEIPLVSENFTSDSIRITHLNSFGSENCNKEIGLPYSYLNLLAGIAFLHNKKQPTVNIGMIPPLICEVHYKDIGKTVHKKIFSFDTCLDKMVIQFIKKDECNDFESIKNNLDNITTTGNFLIVEKPDKT